MSINDNVHTIKQQHNLLQLLRIDRFRRTKGGALPVQMLTFEI